jgi:magnesium-protoporphyrin IX monomethyl ester (oxidative) cyclase
MFLGIEALDEQGLALYRKRVSPDTNMKALECARQLGIDVAINLIVDPHWDERQFELVRQFALSVPEIVHLTVITPYPGTEIWHAQAQKLTTRDYRLFDIQHAVLPTKLPLPRFYEELVKTQGVINRKFMGPSTAANVLGILARQLARGQTNFLRMLWKFNSVYDARRQYGEHFRPVSYEIPLPGPSTPDPRDRTALYVHRRPSAGARAT